MKSSVTLKSIVREIIYKIPGAKSLWKRWIEGKVSIYSFRGWGMATMTNTPWGEPTDELGRDFLEVHNEVVKAVASGSMKLSQFEQYTDKEQLLEGLMWRHFIVFWSARFAKFSGSKNIAECGVCDGLTAYFALRAVGQQYKAWLFDAWEGMQEERLLDSEKAHVNDYAYLSIDQTKKNLSMFDTVFVKGFIPESFVEVQMPESVGWLHIDLNSSVATMESLKKFYDIIPSGGVILFDDYAGRGFEDTKKAVDAFFSGKNGILMHVPTGQAIYFKK